MFSLKDIRERKTRRKEQELFARRTALLRQNKCPYCERDFVPCRLWHKTAGWRPSLLCPELHYGFLYFTDYGEKKLEYKQLDNLGDKLDIEPHRIKWS